MPTSQFPDKRIRDRAASLVMSCTGKDPLSPGQAQAIIRKRKGWTSYRCRHCGEWHVSGPQGKLRRRK